MIKNCQGPTRSGPTRRARFLKCLGVLLILITIIIVLFLTVFKIKDPNMTLDKITVNLGNNTMVFGSDIVMIADVSIQNPNPASFTFNNFSSNIHYRGIQVGEAHGPSGQARAQDTLRMKLTMEIDTGLMLTAPNVGSDIVSGFFSLDSDTRIPGHVKVLGIVKKNIVVGLNCKASFNLVNQTIQHQSCERYVDLKL